METRHIIKRQVFEVEVPSVDSAWKIQNRISDLYKQELVRILDKVLSEISGPDQVLRIDKLEIDLGEIQADALERDIPEKLQSLLKDQLREILHHVSAAPESQSETEKKKHILRKAHHTKTDILVYFLRTGTTPWWSAKENFTSIASLIKDLLTEKPAWIRSNLKMLLKDPAIRTRFIHHIDDDVAGKFAGLFARENPNAVSAGADLFTILDQNREVIVSVITAASIHQFRFRFWDAVFNCFLFAKTAPLAEFFQRADTQALIFDSDETEATWRKLEHLAVSQKQESLPAGEKGSEDESTIGGRKKVKGKKVRRKIQKSGIPGLQEKQEELTGDSQETDNDQVNEFRPEEQYAEGVSNQNDQSDAADETETEIENTAGEKLKGRRKKIRTRKKHDQNALSPGEFEVGEENPATEDQREIGDEVEQGEINSSDPAKNEYRQQQNIVENAQQQIKDAQHAGETKPGDIHPSSQEDVENLSSAKSAELIKSNSRTEENGDDEDAYEYVYEEDLSDFIVGNAGLVLLWPYAVPFFTGLDLVTGKSFNDKAAAHRAVHLLQYLAAAGLEYEEHDLVLNKLLCGLDLAEPIDMDFVISQREREEAESLLSAIIENWKAIGKTSIDGLRITFLQKEGSLKKTEQGWNLYIERKTVDMLLERLPWAFSIVRLPWSEEVIYVEW
jgi:hypothetical protein